MNTLVTIFLLLVPCLSINLEELMLQEWKTFKLQHSKNYTTKTEEKYHMKVWIDNRLFIAQHNSKYARGKASFTVALNGFADRNRADVHKMRTGFKKFPEKNLTGFERGASFIIPANVIFPDFVDWVPEGAVTPVKDQGECGSCWAFSATGSLEGQHYRKSGKLVSLSEQNLVDCANWWYLNFGCNGGEVIHAFRYVKKYGIDTESSYPYEAKTHKCDFKKDKIGTTEASWVNIHKGNEEDLKAAVATMGPVSVAIDASLRSFQYYSDGVYEDPECSHRLNHAVLIVGYGNEGGKDYWLVKNSWGTSWGYCEDVLTQTCNICQNVF
ncbi:cathepsin L-like [Fopius arisanus]|uniref:Cathepsin L-like n=1 Tax=Fopius arisanus TaxID=64838 RepID=A0A9R1U3S5_9HYME|nr:PREDICTED: cathepsin L-like [Fopius arisanus]